MRKFIVLFLFFFLFLFLLKPAYASFPLIYNVSSTQDFFNLGTVRCINSTADNKVYCYAGWDDGSSAGKLTVFNSTGGDPHTCTVCTACSISAYGLAIVNYTNAVWCAQGLQFYLNITDITTGSCPVIYTNYSGSGICKGGALNSGEFSTEDSLLYFARTSISTLPPTVTSGGTPYWTQSSQIQGELNLPNRSDNATMWIRELNITSGVDMGFFKYVNGVLDSTADNIETSWGISTAHTRSSIINENGTNYIYIVSGLSGSYRIYKANFSILETYPNSSVFNMLAPANLTYKQTDYNNGVTAYMQLNTSDNGTIYVKLDNVFVGSISVNASNNFLAGNSVFSYALPISQAGSYSWKAYFTSSTNNYTWYDTLYSCGASCTGIYFTFVNEADIFTHPGEAIALLIGSIFSITDMTTAKIMSTIVFSFAFSFLIVIILWKFGVHGSDMTGKIFMMSIMLWVIMFSLMGWFPTWLVVIIIVLAGFMFARTMGLGG